jgi:glycerol uptake facilitator-like aquaporin
MSRLRRAAAEALGSAGLLAVVVGSGIMAERLAAGSAALVLLANSLATAGGLVALILTFGPVSGAHFNPVVTLALALSGRHPREDLALYLAAQFGGAVAGVWVAHAMFGLPMEQLSSKLRPGSAMLLSEAVATFGLLMTVFACIRHRPAAAPWAIAAYILAAYWFTASTAFANPAVTMARTLTDTYSGIRLQDAPGFVAAQLLGAALAVAVDRWFYPAGPHVRPIAAAVAAGAGP